MSKHEIIEKRIIDTIQQIRPYIMSDGGDLEFVEFNHDTGQVKVRFLGACVGCYLLDFTLKSGVEALLMERVPEVKEVVAEEGWI